MTEAATATSTPAVPTGSALTKRATAALFGPAAMMTTAPPASKGKVPHDSDTFLSVYTYQDHGEIRVSLMYI